MFSRMKSKPWWIFSLPRWHWLGRERIGRYTDSPMDRAFDPRGPRWLGVAEDLTISDGWRDRIPLGFLGLFSLEGGTEGFFFLWFFSPLEIALFHFLFRILESLNHGWMRNVCSQKDERNERVGNNDTISKCCLMLTSNIWIGRK